MNELPRYSNQSFPAYRYIPGENPHPTRDPDGHSYGELIPEPVMFSLEQWQESEEYLYGVDCFNHGYWWEAHEAFESIWIAAGRTSQTGFFIQGLIQIAVALLKRKQSFIDVSQRMATDGLDKVHPGLRTFMGINVPQLRSDTERFIEDTTIKSITIQLDLN